MAKIKNVFLPDTMVVNTDVSPDQQVAGTQVQSLLVQLAAHPKPPQGATLRVGTNLGDPPVVASQTASLFVQLTGDEPEVPVWVRIMGTVAVQPGARAVLVSRLACSTFSDDLAAAAKDNQLILTHAVKAAPRDGLLVTFFLLVDRIVTDGALPEAFAAVESVEYNFEDPDASKRKA
jgi:hypothetical protein